MKYTSSHSSGILASLAILSLISTHPAQGQPGGTARVKRVHSQNGFSRKGESKSTTVFGVAQSYAAGFGGASQAVTADFNGDGTPDLAVVDPCNSSNCGAGYASVVVLLGNGDGSFQSPMINAIGTYQPMSVATADVNGDGVPDLVVASQCSSSVSCGTGVVSVLLGNGDGTFRSPVPYSTGSGSSYFVAIADLNGDGIPDLAVANQTSANSVVSILLGNGDGTFQSPLSYSTGALSAAYLAVADYNGDGIPDLAVANGGTQDSLSILLGNGNGTFQTAVFYPSGGAYVHAIAPGDLNGDGITDLVTVNGCASDNNLVCSSAGSVGVLIGNGDGTFQPPVTYGSAGNEPSFVAIADFNGDGVLDVVVQNLGAASGGSSAGLVSLLAGNGDGTLQPAATFGSGGNYGASVTTADFNGDGQPDLAVVNQCPPSGSCANSSVGVLLNTAGFSAYANSIALTTAVNPAAANQTVLLSATVTPAFNVATATGSVTFYDGVTELSSVSLTNGQATLNTSFATPGPHYLQAMYSGDSNYAAGFSFITSEIIGTPVQLSSSPNPAVYSQPVTFTATVSGSAPTPTGTVTFQDGSFSLGAVPLVNGIATLNSSSLTRGVHNITASYGGDSNYPAGASAILAQGVTQSSTTALTSSANPASANQTITYTATVSGQTGGTPGGVVAFMQGSPATAWGTAALINGQATLTNQFKSGTYPITALYLGSPAYQSSTSSMLSQVVNSNQMVTTNTTLTSSGSPSIFGQPVTFTATVAPNSGSIPNGETVTFYNGANTLGTGMTANGIATLITSSLPLGTSSITATYAGDTTYASSTSKVLKQVVQTAPSTTTLTSSLNPSTYGQSVMFTATVAPQSGSGTPTGQVTLKNGTTTVGTITLSGGTGTYSTVALPAGSLSITASYGGDSNFAGSSTGLTQTVNVASTATTMTASPTSVSLNQSVTLTATVMGQYGGAVGGTVTFTQGGTTLGSSALAQGKASLTTSFATAGTYMVTATYSGDANDTGSASVPLSLPVGSVSTKTTIASSGSPSFIGQTVTFTATVKAGSVTVPDGENVTFYDGSATMGTSTTSSGVASYSTSALAKGSHTITATYAGDSNYGSSTSKGVLQVVNLYGSNTVLQSSVNPAVYAQSVTYSATVSPATGSLVPTGQVTFKNGTTTLGAVSLINGIASLTTTSSTNVLPAGSNALTVSYPGDSNFTSSSANLSEQVNQATTGTVLTNAPAQATLNQNVTFTATVTGQYSGSTTGSVSFMQGSTLLGSASVTNGKAKLTYAFTTAGNFSITAVYGGDSNNLTSTSTSVSQTVNNASTTTALATSGSPAAVGTPVTFTATVTSSYGSIPNGELVTFYDSSTEIGTGQTNNGVATYTTSTLASGANKITATYAGDSTFETSTSRAVTEVINLNTTTTVVTTNHSSVIYGQPVTFTATVTSAGPTPTGTVTFKNGAAALGTAALNASGVATYSTVTLAAGVASITASYSGDSESIKSTSAAINQVVTQATTTTQLISSVNPASVGESVSFTATVLSPTTVATGTVTFTAGSTTLGTASLVNGSAKLSVSTLASGASTVTATYGGTANIAGSSASITQYVN